MNRRLQTARRQLERLEWEHARALPDSATKLHLEAQIRDARWAVEDEQRAVDTRSVRAARRTAVVLDLVLIVVAVLVMVFSLGNVHRFAVGHGVVDPLGWLLAPAVDLALVGSLSADAFLSRHGSDAGGWAAALRWFAGLATLTLNAWDALTRGAVGDIVATVIPPLLLLLLAEASPRLRQRAHVVVEAVRTQTQRTPDAPGTGAACAMPDARPAGADAPADDTAVAAGQPATAPASDTASVPASEDVSALPSESASERPSAPRPRPRTAASGGASKRVRQTSGTGRNARPVRTDDELLAALTELRTGALEPLSRRAAQAALGIGAPRLRALLDAHGLTLDPIPLSTPRPLRAVETDQDAAPAAVLAQ